MAPLARVKTGIYRPSLAAMQSKMRPGRLVDRAHHFRAARPVEGRAGVLRRLARGRLLDVVCRLFADRLAGEEATGDRRRRRAAIRFGVGGASMRSTYRRIAGSPPTLPIPSTLRSRAKSRSVFLLREPRGRPAGLPLCPGWKVMVRASLHLHARRYLEFYILSTRMTVVRREVAGLKLMGIIYPGLHEDHHAGKRKGHEALQERRVPDLSP
jgi:hypothetical protein